VLGRGTTFTVVLPAAPPLPVVTETSRHVRGDIAGWRILVIDDEPLVRRTLARILTSNGCVVTEAEGGVSGLALATTGSFDRVICDLMMPDLDGAALHDELALQQPALAASMVFISGGAVTERTRAFAARPEISLLAKPFAIDQLLIALTT
jgi:CheY-like chemotaxis protein